MVARFGFTPQAKKERQPGTLGGVRGVLNRLRCDESGSTILSFTTTTIVGRGMDSTTSTATHRRTSAGARTVCIVSSLNWCLAGRWKGQCIIAVKIPAAPIQITYSLFSTMFCTGCFIDSRSASEATT